MGRHRRSAADRAEPAASAQAGAPAGTAHTAGPGHTAHDHDTDAYDAYERAANNRDAAYERAVYGRDAAYGDHATYGGQAAYRAHATYGSRPGPGSHASAPYATSAPYAATAPPAPPAPYATSASYGPYATSEAAAVPSAVPRPADHAVGADGDDHGGGNGHRRKRRGVPMRTGLLGVSAAVALGAVAVGTGLVPGEDSFFGGGHDTKVRAADAPSDERQGDESSAADRTTPAASRGATRSDAPSHATSSSPRTKAKSKGGAAPSPSRSATAQRGTGAATSPGAGTTRTATPPKSATPARTKPASQAPAQPPVVAAPSGEESAAAAAVLVLVNQERAKVGCSAVRADDALASLATAFSDDMAARGFFDHTDPDGDTPWDRAKQAGISNLGGENIARGQADAAAVMESWMNSPGHRANILNCDYKTLGVGVHFGSGGPWWTQDFGF
ncbi:CAP domain-containing protein [Streptomyces sp. NRRL F-5630]|uniref:CAP domain-containing protein n=1 Tax=Streptomyces sp. NRRL F-5630 TaxID=1463864 RepID=UPI003D764933